jgi:hypothetical protein
MEQKKKKNLLSIVIMVAVVVIAANLGPKLFNSKENNILNENNTLSERAIIMNKDCPFMIDENTRLDSVTSPKKDVLQNNYTLLNDNVADINVDIFKDIFKLEITNHLKSNKETEFFRKNNATLIYKYFDKEKQFVTEIVILPSDYQ